MQQQRTELRASSDILYCLGNGYPLRDHIYFHFTSKSLFQPFTGWVPNPILPSPNPVSTPLFHLIFLFPVLATWLCLTSVYINYIFIDITSFGSSKKQILWVWLCYSSVFPRSPGYALSAVFVPKPACLVVDIHGVPAMWWTLDSNGRKVHVLSSAIYESLKPTQHFLLHSTLRELLAVIFYTCHL